MGFSLPVLPLSPIDAKNNPPDYYLWVQDYVTILMGILWIAAYILYIRQSYRDKSYGMPILSLCANIAWEFVYGVINPPGFAEFVTFLPYFLVDLGLVYTTIKFGPYEWAHSPIVKKNLPLIMLVGCGMLTWAQWAIAVLFDDVHEASFWSGFACQLIGSWAALAQLISRASTRGHTIAIWWYRFTGTLCAIFVFQWRVYYYPQDYTYIHTHAANFIFFASEIGELAYPVVFMYIRRREEREDQEKRKLR
jgi:paspaline synthase